MYTILTKLYTKVGQRTVVRLKFCLSTIRRANSQLIRLDELSKVVRPCQSSSQTNYSSLVEIEPLKLRINLHKFYFSEFPFVVHTVKV